MVGALPWIKHFHVKDVAPELKANIGKEPASRPAKSTSARDSTRRTSADRRASEGKQLERRDVAGNQGRSEHLQERGVHAEGHLRLTASVLSVSRPRHGLAGLLVRRHLGVNTLQIAFEFRCEFLTIAG